MSDTKVWSEAEREAAAKSLADARPASGQGFIAYASIHAWLAYDNDSDSCARMDVRTVLDMQCKLNALRKEMEEARIIATAQIQGHFMESGKRCTCDDCLRAEDWLARNCSPTQPAAPK